MSKMALTAVCVALGVLTFCSGCGHSQQAPQAQLQINPTTSTPIADKKAELGQPSWDPAWDRMVEEALPADLLSAKVERDVKPFCPEFGTMSEADKRAYWAYFFQALAGAEAGLQPEANVRHKGQAAPVKDTVSGRMVRTQGLLQLTYMDATRYGCDFDWEKDKLLAEHDPAKTILQPKNNLTCGVKILEKQIIEQGKPLLSRSSYWSTLRPGSAAERAFVKQMANVPATCGRTPARVKRKKAPAPATSATGAARQPAVTVR